MRTLKFRCLNAHGVWEISDDTCFMDDFWKWIDTMNWKKETLGQFTGLKDKNNKEIYQGDILKLNNDSYDPGYEGYYTGLAVVDPQTCGFTLKPIPKLEEPNIYDSTMFWHVGEDDTTEIIGNIYENTELLKT